MLTVIATGDREADLFHWAGILEKNPTIQNIPSIDCSTSDGLQKLTQKVETISLLSSENPIVASAVEITTDLAKLLIEYSQDIYILSPTGKLPKLEKAKIITDKVTDLQLKSLISDSLRATGLTPTREEIARIYLPLTYEDFMGKEKLSPLRTLTFVRQLKTIIGTSSDEARKLLSALIGLSEGKASQWEILANLFTTNKAKQQEYFMSLTEHMSPYEIMAIAKTSLLLVMVILVGRNEHLDSASIASKIGKNPFYVSSLLRTTQEKEITYEKASRMLARLLNLETALKSGKFDDEQFGFEVLLATI